MSSEKRVVLITGANGGIGFDATVAIAKASSNYHVVMGSRSIEKGEKALADVKSRDIQGSVSLVQLDVTDDASIATAVKTVESDFGRLDCLVNNAGIVTQGSTTKETLQKTFETNTFAPAVVTEAFVHLLKKSEDARLVYVTSDLGSITLRRDPNNKYFKLPAMEYRMSKAALNMLTVCHYAELDPAGVKVFAFNPGYVVTNLTGEADRENRVQRGAGSSEVSGQTILTIVAGERDDDVGKLVVKEGILPW